MGKAIIQINKRYGVISDMYSEDNDDYIETNTYAEACQIASRMVKDKEVETAYVIIQFSSDQGEYHA